MNYNKVLSSKKQYKEIEKEVELLTEVEKLLQEKNIPYLNQHEHRYWEYGNALSAIKDKYGRRTSSVSILDVGGAGSLFGVTAAYNGYNVTQVDPDNHIHDVNKQNEILKSNMAAIKSKFQDYQDGNQYDVVTSLSVIEHVPDDMEFIKILAGKVKEGGLLILTTDFHPSGEQRLPWHIRAYNEVSFLNLKDNITGFKFYNDEFDYSKYLEMVNNYSFAMMVLEKE